MSKEPMAWKYTNDDGDTYVDHHVRFVCTDKGTHPNREIGVIARHSDHDEMVIAPTDKMSHLTGRYHSGRARVKAPLTHEGKGIIFDDVTWRLRCPTCHREIQWRLGRAIETLDTLVASRVLLVDISRLPAILQ